MQNHLFFMFIVIAELTDTRFEHDRHICNIEIFLNAHALRHRKVKILILNILYVRTNV